MVLGMSQWAQYTQQAPKIFKVISFKGSRGSSGRYIYIYVYIYLFKHIYIYIYTQVRLYDLYLSFVSVICICRLMCHAHLLCALVICTGYLYLSCASVMRKCHVYLSFVSVICACHLYVSSAFVICLCDVCQKKERGGARLNIQSNNPNSMGGIKLVKWSSILSSSRQVFEMITVAKYHIQ